MADLYAPSLVEQVVEVERDLLARRRLYHNRTYTRRLTAERAERRIEIWQSILAALRAQLSHGELEQLEARKQQAQQRRKAKRERKAAERVRHHG